MKVLVTGSKGFIGKNLIAELHNQNHEVLEFDLDTTADLLNSYCEKCEFIFHLAGINRPKDVSEFMEGNLGFTTTLLQTLRRFKNNCPILLSSSIQAELNNPYGQSKKAGEQALIAYGEETGAPIHIYRFSNLFGKWCRPNYNSVVATFCHNIANELPITIHDPSTVLNLVYIDDVVEALIHSLNGTQLVDDNGFCVVPISHTVSLEKIAALLYSYKESRNNLSVPVVTEGSFEKKLYSTYLSYLPKDNFSYPLKMNVDERGSFTEILKSIDFGQVSVNITKPGIEKGNHWHHTKNEKFIVVSGQGLIQFRLPDSNEITGYYISGEKIQVVDIPVGYTHCIRNIGNTDLITIMWCNECFNPDKPDTYFLKVNKEI